MERTARTCKPKLHDREAGKRMWFDVSKRKRQLCLTRMLAMMNLQRFARLKGSFLGTVAEKSIASAQDRRLQEDGGCSKTVVGGTRSGSKSHFPVSGSHGRDQTWVKARRKSPHSDSSAAKVCSGRERNGGVGDECIAKEQKMCHGHRSEDSSKNGATPNESRLEGGRGRIADNQADRKEKYNEAQAATFK